MNAPAIFSEEILSYNLSDLYSCALSRTESLPRNGKLYFNVVLRISNVRIQGMGELSLP